MLRKLAIITALFTSAVLGMYSIAIIWWEDIQTPTIHDYTVAGIVVVWLISTVLIYISIMITESKNKCQY